MSKQGYSFYQVPTVVFEDNSVSADAKLVLAYLIYNEAVKTKRKDKVSGIKYSKGDFIPLYQVCIANAIHKSTESVRQRYIPELIKGGYISKRLINGIKGTAQNTICEYSINWENLNNTEYD